jgi:hypothetical protein
MWIEMMNLLSRLKDTEEGRTLSNNPIISPRSLTSPA